MITNFKTMLIAAVIFIGVTVVVPVIKPDIAAGLEKNSPSLLKNNKNNEGKKIVTKKSKISVTKIKKTSDVSKKVTKSFDEMTDMNGLFTQKDIAPEDAKDGKNNIWNPTLTLFKDLGFTYGLLFYGLSVIWFGLLKSLIDQSNSAEKLSDKAEKDAIKNPNSKLENRKKIKTALAALNSTIHGVDIIIVIITLLAIVGTIVGVAFALKTETISSLNTNSNIAFNSMLEGGISRALSTSAIGYKITVLLWIIFFFFGRKSHWKGLIYLESTLDFLGPDDKNKLNCNNDSISNLIRVNDISQSNNGGKNEQ